MEKEIKNETAEIKWEQLGECAKESTGLNTGTEHSSVSTL